MKYKINFMWFDLEYTLISLICNLKTFIQGYFLGLILNVS